MKLNRKFLAYFLSVCFTVIERNLVLLILDKMSRTGDEMITLSYEEITDKTPLAKIRPVRITEFLERFASKISGFKVMSRKLFSVFYVDYENRVIIVGLTKGNRWIIDSDKADCFNFKLAQFSKLKTKHGQELYLCIISHINKHHLDFNDIFELRHVMNVPELCPNGKIKRKIIEPALMDINSNCVDITNVECHLDKQGKSHKIIGVYFTWDPNKSAKTSNIQNKK